MLSLLCLGDSAMAARMTETTYIHMVRVCAWKRHHFLQEAVHLGLPCSITAAYEELRVNMEATAASTRG